ncbi:MAG TPA: N-acetylmuramoyl-L-alanine amidase [Rhodospirillaceae bacterium]|nr:N-acetylmuramoyl-L-alanine amidase [Rhodospirillaceae bacterium]MAX64611.1 N-acetylmuramoyl-L-alanine amidase [Rhodospirillaceae bacterium]MBB58521.1 N-acetylmuramoyl-L-alanine amidase [Rhodospirillaceae bacterium]HAE02133.1 N-acetylmuramoyl-L-alanine amidase [Rhodospirillaceae bacterium]HAJ21006.1 N-acetylmuramoyl-L-alanine amidase [Rhodospirillaceae bacterium]|tara:strand:+ start:3559 stop:4242 length:684 start_codon:yes stop_codon:yes gene_type:complete
MRMIETPSPNFGDRRGGDAVTMLVIHYTGMRSAAESLARLCDPAAEVSAHYLITEDGDVHRLVAEEKRAWHAGLGQWQGDRDVNSRSIGIELQNLGHEFGYQPFPAAQIDSLIDLALGILDRHAIPASGIVGHSDIAPDRKLDPGELFPWPVLAAAGIGVFPEAGIDTEEDLESLLTRIGYDPMAQNRISAFLRRFRPDRIDGQPDIECQRLAAAYLAANNHQEEPI